MLKTSDGSRIFVSSGVIDKLIYDYVRKNLIVMRVSSIRGR